MPATHYCTIIGVYLRGMNEQVFPISFFHSSSGSLDERRRSKGFTFNTICTVLLCLFSVYLCIFQDSSSTLMLYKSFLEGECNGLLRVLLTDIMAQSKYMERKASNKCTGRNKVELLLILSSIHTALCNRG